MRQISALEEVAEISIYGYEPFPPKIHFTKLFPVKSLTSIRQKIWKYMLGALLVLRAFKISEYLYCRLLIGGKIKDCNFKPDALLVNDINAMPIALEYLKASNKAGAPIYLDLHEYGPAEGSEVIDRLVKNPFKNHLCNRYLAKAKVCSTVSKGLAQAYGKLLGREPEIIPNVPPYQDLSPKIVSESKIRLVHHGGVVPGRNILGMIDAVKILGSKYELHFYLMGDDRQINKLRTYAKDIPVFFHPPVATKEIASVLNKYDIGVYLLRENNFNNTYAMPNKIYEFVQARLAIVTSSNPEMRDFVLENNVGRISDQCDGRSMAAVIKGMSPENILKYKYNSDNVARKYCSEKYFASIRGLIMKAMGVPDIRCVE